MERRRFRDRAEAGRMLAERLRGYARRDDVVVLALPRGGIPVAYEVARALDAPLRVFLVRKLGVPGHEELAMGALATGGVLVLDERLVQALGLGEAELERAIAAEARRGIDQDGRHPDLQLARPVGLCRRRCDLSGARRARGGHPDDRPLRRVRHAVGDLTRRSARHRRDRAPARRVPGGDARGAGDGTRVLCARSRIRRPRQHGRLDALAAHGWFGTASPDVALAASPPSTSTVAGGAVAYTAAVTPSNGFAEDVSLYRQRPTRRCGRELRPDRRRRRVGVVAALSVDLHHYADRQLSARDSGDERLGVPNALTALDVAYKGKNSRTCAQTVAVWSWVTSSWLVLDARDVGTSEELIPDLAPGGTLADYVSGSSGSGELGTPAGPRDQAVHASLDQ